MNKNELKNLKANLIKHDLRIFAKGWEDWSGTMLTLILGYELMLDKVAELAERDEWLTYLEQAGVDNWVGYGEAQQAGEDDQ